MFIRSKFMVFAGFSALLLFVWACSGTPNPQMQMQEQMSSTLKGPREGVYLRASFDDDPSHFIGRFLSNELPASEIDENRGIQTECSAFVTYREVRAAGNFDEYYNSSTSVGAELGIDTSPAADIIQTGPGGTGEFSTESGTSIRVQYNLSRKLIAHVEDPAGFRACCDSIVGGCTNRFVGEFWAGTGTIYERSGRATDVGARGNAPHVKAGFEVADGWVWRRGTEFDDVYFAFRVVDRVATDDCGWVDQLPRSQDGKYFVGISPPSATEDIARTMAMRHARTQAVQYLGESILAESRNVSSVIEGYIESEIVVTTAAEGLAQFVKDDRYCAAEQLETPEGVKYIARVLAFFPKESEDEARKATLDAVEGQIEADGALTDEVREALDGVRGGL